MKVLKVNPKDPEANYNLGVLYFSEKKDKVSALKYLNLGLAAATK
jgi:hypothetical protein